MKLTLIILSLVIVSFIAISCKSNDWANRSHYKKQNKLLDNLSPYEQRVVFMGNSITEGWADHHPEFFEKKTYINRGISGQTTDQMVERFDQDVIKLKPAVVVILAGTNDIAQNRGPVTHEEIIQNIAKMVDQAQQNSIKVILCSVLPAYDYPWKKGLHPNEKIPKLNTMLKELAADKNAYYLDYFSAMATEQNGLIENYGYDGVHPNATGYKVMEPLVKKAIDYILRK